MNKNNIAVTHRSPEDHDVFIQSISSYGNPTHRWDGRIETQTNSDGSVTTTIERDSVLDYTGLGQNAKLTDGSIEIGTDDD